MSAKPRLGLGRGIESLISSDFDKGVLDSGERVQNLFTNHISPLKDQPRKHFDELAIQELAQSISQYGILQPLIVSQEGEAYTIIAGERRWRAAKSLGLDKVPAIVRKQKEQEKLEIALIENVQRVDLSALEQAATIEQLHSEFNLSYNDIAKRLGKASTTVNNIVRLLQLPKTAIEALQSAKITEGHARAILSLKNNPELQLKLLDEIIKHGWSVRQAEQFAVTSKQGSATKQIKQKMQTTTPETKKLSEKLKTNVSIKRTARGGRIEIHFKNEEELNQLLGRMS